MFVCPAVICLPIASMHLTILAFPRGLPLKHYKDTILPYLDCGQ